jgi:hypothetical protein
MRTDDFQPHVLRATLQTANLATATAIRALAFTALGLSMATGALAIDPALCRDDGVTEVPSFAAGRDSNQCLRIDPGNGDPDVLIQYETFHKTGTANCSGSGAQVDVSIPDSCSTKLGGNFCSMVVWDTVIDNYTSQSCKNKDGIYFGEGTAMQYYLMKDVKVLNTWKCSGGSGWVGPNGIRCDAGEDSSAHTDGIQLRGNPSGGGWWVMQDSQFVNGFNLHFLHQVTTKWGEKGSVMFQGVDFGRRAKAGVAVDYIQDCLKRGVTNNTGLCTDGYTLIDSATKEYWLVDVYGTAKMRPVNNDKIIIVNTGCGDGGCGGATQYASGWPHPLHCGGDRTGPGTCPNGPIGSCSAGSTAYCYTSLEEAAKAHKLPPFAHLSSAGWASAPVGATKRPLSPVVFP